jgi:pyruvate dehydrogenase E2 component (dihydrolipoamide acetyltransferase)
VAKDILMPQMGYDMTEGTVVRWVKKVGDRVHRGDIVAEIETDKATVEIEAFESGTLLQILAEPGDTIPVGVPIATVGEQGEALPEPALKPTPEREPAAVEPPLEVPAREIPARDESARDEPARDEPARDEPARDQPAPTAPPARPSFEYAGEQPHASPLARKMAERFGVDLRGVRGSGPGGRIVAADIEAAQSAPAATAPAAASPATSSTETAPVVTQRAPLPEGAEEIEPTRLRRAIARRMSESKRNAPHFYVSVDIGADKLLALRKRLNAKGGQVSVNDFLIKAIALAAVVHPNVNAAYADDRVRRFKRVDVGMAVATDNGLLSPAILDGAAKDVLTISQESRDLAERARSGHLRADEYGGGTITLSNLGMYGIDQFLAILNPPQALIVSVGAAADRVVVKSGRPGVAKVITAWAAADHRVLDGAEVAQFMATFRGLVEDPRRLNP